MVNQPPDLYYRYALVVWAVVGKEEEESLLSDPGSE